MGWPCREADEAIRLLHRARILLDGYSPTYGSGENKFGAASVMTTERGNTAILRAAAVLANAAVSLLADEIEFRERVFTEEELDEMLNAAHEQDANPPQTPEAADDQASVEERQASETPRTPSPSGRAK